MIGFRAGQKTNENWAETGECTLPNLFGRWEDCI